MALRAARRIFVSSSHAFFPRRALAPLGRRFATDADSHNDFAPKSKISGDAELIAQLSKVTVVGRWIKHNKQNAKCRLSVSQIVKDHKVVLFMKGTPEQPMCGFSAKVVKLLHMNGESKEPLFNTRGPYRDPTGAHKMQVPRSMLLTSYRTRRYGALSKSSLAGQRSRNCTSTATSLAVVTLRRKCTTAGSWGSFCSRVARRWVA